MGIKQELEKLVKATEEVRKPEKAKEASKGQIQRSV